MGSQLIVRLDDKTKKQFQELCRREGKTSSEVVRRLVAYFADTMPRVSEQTVPLSMELI